MVFDQVVGDERVGRARLGRGSLMIRLRNFTGPSWAGGAKNVRRAVHIESIRRGGLVESRRFQRVDAPSCVAYDRFVANQAD